MAYTATYTAVIYRVAQKSY